MRWFPRSAISVPDALWLDLILYSRDQVEKEASAMQRGPTTEAYEWAIISIKGQLEDFETPMSPITAMRNALGKEEGGSGTPLNRSKYLEAVAYWEKHASIV
jgi:hypothetical protein